MTIVTPLKYPIFKTKRRHFTPFKRIYCAAMKNAVRTFLTVLLFVFKLLPFLSLFIACSKTYILRGSKKSEQVFNLLS